MHTTGGGGLQESSYRPFQAYGEPLETVTLFNYLGQIMTAGGGDWPAVAGKLRKVRKSWTRTTRILGQEGAYPRISSFFPRRLFRWCCFL